MNDSISVESTIAVARVEAVQRTPEVKQDEERAKKQDEKREKAPPAEKTLSREESQKIVDLLKDSVRAFNTEITFNLDPETGSHILVLEKETGKVVRQIPPKEVEVLRQKMDEINGIIFNTQI